MAATKVSAPQLSKELPLKQCLAYEQAALAVLDRAVTKYVDYVKSDRPALDPHTWKLLKSHDKIKIFRSRERLQPNVFADASSDVLPALAPVLWAPYSSLLAVGVVDGNLDDVMYAAVTPTEHAMAARSVLVSDEFKYHRVLQDIKLPSPENPFQYVGLKWVFRAAEIASIVRARDLVYVEASGFRSVSFNGLDERVGYVVYHSVDIPELNSRKKKVVRGRMSLCMLFRQKADGVVEVYTTVTADPGGSLKPKRAAPTYARALVALASAGDCAQRKKLAWLQRTNAEKNVDGENVAVAKVHGSQWCCLQCARNLSSFSSLKVCGVCQKTVCSRCVTSKKLALGSTIRDLSFKSVQVCKECVTATMTSMDAVTVATDEYVKNRSTVPSPTFEIELKSDEAAALPQQPSEKTTIRDSSNKASPPRGLKSDSITPTPPRMELSDLREERDSVELIQPVPVGKNDKARLFMQMKDLCKQAEDTFTMTVLQTKTLVPSKPSDRSAFSKSALY